MATATWKIRVESFMLLKPQFMRWLVFFISLTESSLVPEPLDMPVEDYLACNIEEGKPTHCGRHLFLSEIQDSINVKSKSMNSLLSSP